MTHHWNGEAAGGRFAKTSCRPKGYKGVIEVTTDENKVECQKCLKALCILKGCDVETVQGGGLEPNPVDECQRCGAQP